MDRHKSEMLCVDLFITYFLGRKNKRFKDAHFIQKSWKGKQMSQLISPGRPQEISISLLGALDQCLGSV